MTIHVNQSPAYAKALIPRSHTHKTDFTH